MLGCLRFGPDAFGTSVLDDIFLFLMKTRMFKYYFI